MSDPPLPNPKPAWITEGGNGISMTSVRDFKRFRFQWDADNFETIRIPVIRRRSCTFSSSSSYVRDVRDVDGNLHDQLGVTLRLKLETKDPDEEETPHRYNKLSLPLRLEGAICFTKYRFRVFADEVYLADFVNPRSDHFSIHDGDAGSQSFVEFKDFQEEEIRLLNAAKCLRIELEIEFSLKKVIRPTEPKIYREKLTLRPKLKAFINSNSLISDVTLVCDGEHFPTFKMLLAARSDVFQANFQTPTRDVKEGKIIIEDISADVMALFLEFLVTDEIDWSLHADHAQGLFKVGDKYNVGLLKMKSSDFISTHLSEGNVIKSLILGHVFEERQIISAAIKFLRMHKGVVTLMGSEEWKKMYQDYPSIVNHFVVTE